MEFIWPKSAHRKGIYKMDIIAFHHLLNFWALTEQIVKDQSSVAYLYFIPSAINQQRGGRRERGGGAKKTLK